MKRNFIYLAVVTVIALVLVFIGTPTDRSSEKSAVDELLLPAIAAEINQVDHVEVVTAGDTTVATLLRKDDAWQVEQMGGYRADWPKLQKLLAALAQARVVEPKTDKPEYYARLGVEDISNPDAGGVLVRLGVGDQLTGILIGHAAEGRKGQYVRRQDATASALVDQEFEVPRETLAWADARIIDINASQVAEVEIIHPTSERVLVTKVSADETDFELEGLPEGREVKSSWTVNSLGSVFSLLNLQSVRPADGVDWSNAVKLRLLTFAGVEILADLCRAVTNTCCACTPPTRPHPSFPKQERRPWPGRSRKIPARTRNNSPAATRTGRPRRISRNRLPRTCRSRSMRSTPGSTAGLTE